MKKEPIQLIKTAEEAEALVDELFDLREKARAAKAAEEALSERVKAWLAEHDNVCSGKIHRAILQYTERNTLDKEKVLAEYPDAKKYIKTTKVANLKFEM